MHFGALRGASFVVGGTCEWGVAKKDNKSSAKIKAFVQRPKPNRGFAFRLLCFYWPKKTIPLKQRPLQCRGSVIEDYNLGNRGAEFSHTLGKPRWHTSTVKRKVRDARPFHAQIVTKRVSKGLR